MSDREKVQPPNWRDVNIDVAKMILAQSDAYLRAQMQLALDADKRALTLAAGCITFSTASFAASLVAFNAHAAAYFMYSLIAVSIWVLIAACICFFAARPVPFGLPGSQPRQWWGVTDEELNALIGGETENYQERIDINSAFLVRNSIYVKISMIMFSISPVVFAAACFATLGSDRQILLEYIGKFASKTQ